MLGADVELRAGGSRRHREATEGRIPAEAEREPAVAVLDDALERVRALSAEQDRRAALLHGLRPRPDRIEADEVALELRLVLRPDLLHREHLLAHLVIARLEDGAVVFHL